MSLFSGVHEVRLLRSPGVATGYFNEWDAALRAVENEPSPYKAAYFTLNPVTLPSGIPVNPSSLNSSRKGVSDSDVERLTSLLIDFDPPRDASTNSTEHEKEVAREQAQHARTYLTSKGWPEPMLGDSGNGWHLIYRIALSNDKSGRDLLRAVLARLKHLFPLVDQGNFNASRLCKLYGSWVRKGLHSEERPWRRSQIVESGSEVIVTQEQLQALAPVVAIPVALKSGANVKLERLLGFLEYYSVAVRSDTREVSGGWQVEIECPWIAEHSGETRRDTVVSFIAGLGNGFRCLHSHCVDRHWREFRFEMERQNPGLVPYFGKLPKMTHSAIARHFVEEHEDFVRIYDMDNETGVWMQGVRWQIGDQGDACLRMAIRMYLDKLYDRYPAPEANKPDSRRALQQAPFVSGVLAEVKPFLPPKSIRDFDTDPAILPLPNGKVANLREGIIRNMQREDCQTKRITIMPADIPTPRWDRFKREITCGNVELEAYLVRLMALAITGLAPHLLVIFYGNGRNGKGIALRILEKILGRDLFAVSIRPEDVEYRRGAEDRNKRLMGRLHGKRLAFTSETVSTHLDWTLLKVLSGGDTLAGAALYENTRGFAPTHTLILTTNDRPKFPPTMAFKERVRIFPFDGDFSKSRDFTVEDDLAREAPGILWQLIQIAPSVFVQGDEAPDCVREATQDVLDENDVARPFIEQCLEEHTTAITPIPDLEKAIRKWIGGVVVGEDARFEQILAGVKAKWRYGRKQVSGTQTRGLLGVRIRSAS